jgi:opacity protein-like surface antigen
MRRVAAVVVVLLAGAVAVQVQDHAQAQTGNWITDTSAGCKVWNPHPQPNESIHWSGACADGFAQGRGAAQWFRNNLPFETDEGEWRAGRQAGYGTQVWPSGRYDGQLVDGEPHGHGVMIVQGARYEGDFRNGRPNGAGTLTNGSGSFRGAWTNGCFREGSRKASFSVPLSTCP